MPPEIFLFGALGLLLVFMIFNTRKRTQKMREEQEAKRLGTVPGAKVLLQGGLYGTVISYDHEDLDAPAFVELAPGVVVEIHSQAVLRVVDPIDPADELEGPDSITIETEEETRARLKRDESDK
jgi:preprotein translocase subunit YajC